MTKKKKEVTVEKVGVDQNVDWGNAKFGLETLLEDLDSEVTVLQSSSELRNAYGPVAWIALCRRVQKTRDGMAAIRLSAEGIDSRKIGMLTGVQPQRTAAFKAVNTRWMKSFHRYISARWSKPEERQAASTFSR